MSRITEGAAATSAAPFDGAGESYDLDFTHRPLGRILREAVWAELDACFGAGDRVLDLGCGTGEDAVRLASRGVRVTATDQSTRMLEVARRRADDAGLGDRVRFVRADLSGSDPLGSAAGPPLFDGAFSNFGALNCLERRDGVARELAARLGPGAPVGLVLMGPLCPWEVAWYLLRLSPRTALRRLRPGGIEAHVGEPPAPVRVWYPGPRRVAAEFSPWFRHRRTVGIGVVLPPPYLEHLVAERPRLRARLATWDRRLGRRFPGTWLNDHYLLLLERR